MGDTPHFHITEDIMATKKVIQEPDRDELAQIIAESLNKTFKDSDQVAYFLDGREETPTDFTDFISTGATMLDVAVSNRPHGGIAVGRITELTGLEGSGKSLVGAQLIANAQKRGGVGVLIDTETAVNPEFFRAVGIDTNKLVYVHLQTVEEIFDAIVNIIEKVRAGKDKNKLVTIVVDSVAAASTKKEMEADFGKDGYATDKAIIISKAMRKITGLLGRERIALVFTNQLRQKMNAMAFSDPWTTSGGKAIAFHASTRLRLALTGKITNSAGDVIGVKVKATVVKNRLGPPHRVAEFEIYFNRGIDDTGAWLKMMKELKLVKQGGAWYTYEDATKGEIKFQSKDFSAFLEEDAERKELIYQQICDSLIMKYQSEFDPEDVNISAASDDE
jgi:recombination protein RecA